MDPNFFYYLSQNYQAQRFQLNQQNNVNITPSLPPNNVQQTQSNLQQNLLEPRVQPNNVASSSAAAASQQTEDVSSDSNDQKTTRERWTKDQTRVFMSMYQDNFDELLSSRCNQVWSSIASAVSKHGPVKTTQKCKLKLRTLKDAYNKCKAANTDPRNSGDKRRTCPYYDELDVLLSDRPCTSLTQFAEVGIVRSNEVCEAEIPSFDMEERTPAPTLENISTEENTAEIPEVAAVADDQFRESDAETDKKKLKRKFEGDDDWSYDEENDDFYEGVKAKAKAKGKEKKPKKKPKTFQEQLIELQKEQMNRFEASEDRFQKFQEKMIEKQMELDAKEKDKERDFFMKFGALFANNNDHRKDEKEK